MKLKDEDVELKKIFLDPFNPRFIDQSDISQEDIIRKIFRTRDAKDLLQSMKIDIKWINKVVLVRKCDFTDKQNNVTGIEAAEFMVVEGNNRLACLKSGKVSNVDEISKIPVLIAEKEANESIEDFLAQIRITQGIANVMVVKEWSVIAKARHLHNMYSDIKNKTPNDSLSKPHEIHKKISSELGLKITEVRQMIVRYEFYKTINEISDDIPEDRWGYLEAFDRNKEIRFKFGMNQETNEFSFEEEEDEYCEEILMEVPALIKKAAYDGVNTKQFRDIISSLIEKKTQRDEIFELITEITDKDTLFNFNHHLNLKSKATEKETWKTELESIKLKLESYPSLSEWSGEHVDLLHNILEVTKRLEGIINENS